MEKEFNLHKATEFIAGEFKERIRIYGIADVDIPKEINDLLISLENQDILLVKKLKDKVFDNAEKDKDKMQSNDKINIYKLSDIIRNLIEEPKEEST